MYVPGLRCLNRYSDPCENWAVKFTYSQVIALHYQAISTPQYLPEDRLVPVNLMPTDTCI